MNKNSFFSFFFILSIIALWGMIIGCGGPDVRWDPNGGNNSASNGDNNGTDNGNNGANNGDNDDAECIRSVDCDDRKVNTVDTCVDGVCEHQEIQCPPGHELNLLGACVPNACQLPVEEERDACLIYSCDTQGEVTEADRSCDDGNADTADACDSVDGCFHLPDCRHDDDPCTAPEFDQSSRSCRQRDRCTPDQECRAGACVTFQCEDDGDCESDDLCVISDCIDGFCQGRVRDCNDDNALTTDACDSVSGTCQHTPIGCTEGPDRDPCTVDTCEDGIRYHLAKDCGEQSQCNPRTGECEVLECDSDEDCNVGGNACNPGLCGVGGVCRFSPVQCGENQLCDSRTGDCRDLRIECSERCRSDRNFHRFCEEQVCRQERRVQCGEGTVLDPNTNRCVVAQGDPGCEEGETACVLFERDGLVHHAACIRGNFFSLDVCGSPDESNCIDTRGCAFP